MDNLILELHTQLIEKEQKINELRDRINKAIEYLNGHKEYLKRLDEQGAYYSTIEVRMCDEMIHILKGEQ